MALPPVDEQAEVLEAVDGGTGACNGAIARAESEIAFLREYRTRLIADVVTGKLDVREAAAKLPDEPDEPEPLDVPDESADGDEDTVNDLDAATEESEA